MNDGEIQGITLRYEGEGLFKAHFVPAQKMADKFLVIGESYLVDIGAYRLRTLEHHRFFFAAVAKGWKNLPDPWPMMLPTPEHLRKYALIKAGYCETQTFVCKSKTECQRMAEVVKWTDTYALCEITGNVLTIHRAKSQRWSAMPARQFLEVTTKVYQVIGDIIGVDPSTLVKATEEGEA